jgi:protocatechuate 3,4-dioxygenase beta subunit
LYFPDQPLNAKDGLFRRKTKAEQEMMTAKLDSLDSAIKQFSWDIFLENVW